MARLSVTELHDELSLSTADSVSEYASDEEEDNDLPEGFDPVERSITLRRLAMCSGARSVNNYEKLNRIEEGAYGVVCTLFVLP